MKRSQVLQLELSRNNQKLNDLLGKGTDLSDEQRSEMDTLTSRNQEAQVEFRAAVVSEDNADDEKKDDEKKDDEKDDEKGDEKGDEKAADKAAGDGNDSEFRALIDRASAGEVAAAVRNGHDTEGATRELQQELGLSANDLPTHLLMEMPVEKRAAGVRTPAATNVGATQMPIIPALFPRSVLGFLQIASDIIPNGETIYTVVTASAAPGTPAVDAAHASTAAALTSFKLAPTRIQAGLAYDAEDAARFQMMDATLRMNLTDALTAKLDKVVVDDLLTGATLASNDAAAVDTYALFRDRFLYSRVEGLHAYKAADIKILVGAKTYAGMAATYRAAETEANALTSLEAESGGVEVSTHTPILASKKQNNLVRIGAEKDYAVGIWAGIRLITDEVTEADDGRVKLTGVMLHAKGLLRAAGFAKVQSQLK